MVLSFEMLAALLAVLAFLTSGAILHARQAILAGNWLLHRQRMLVALALWAGTFALALVLLPHVSALPQPPLLAVGIPLVFAIGTSGLLLHLLALMAQHRFLEHKLLARKVVWAWLGACIALAVGFLAAASLASA